MANYCCYSYYMSEFVTNVIKLIQDVKFLLQICSPNHVFLFMAHILCANCMWDGWRAVFYEEPHKS